MIECQLVSMPQYSAVQIANNGKNKYGRYNNRYFHGLKGYGKKAFAVWIDLEANIKDFEKTNSEELFFHECVEFLNTPLKKKTSKTGKRRKQPQYGLTFNKQVLTSIRRNSENPEKVRFDLLVTTAQRKHKNFWFEGPGAEKL